MFCTEHHLQCTEVCPECIEEGLIEQTEDGRWHVPPWLRKGMSGEVGLEDMCRLLAPVEVDPCANEEYSRSFVRINREVQAMEIY